METYGLEVAVRLSRVRPGRTPTDPLPRMLGTRTLHAWMLDMRVRRSALSIG